MGFTVFSIFRKLWNAQQGICCSCKRAESAKAPARPRCCLARGTVGRSGKHRGCSTCITASVQLSGLLKVACRPPSRPSLRVSRSLAALSLSHSPTSTSSRLSRRCSAAAAMQYFTNSYPHYQAASFVAPVAHPPHPHPHLPPPPPHSQHLPPPHQQHVAHVLSGLPQQPHQTHHHHPQAMGSYSNGFGEGGAASGSSSHGLSSGDEGEEEEGAGGYFAAPPPAPAPEPQLPPPRATRMSGRARRPSKRADGSIYLDGEEEHEFEDDERGAARATRRGEREEEEEEPYEEEYREGGPSAAAGGGGDMASGEGGAGEDEHEPLYVNAKQYHRILKRRAARARLEELGRLSRQRKVRDLASTRSLFISPCSY